MEIEAADEQLAGDLPSLLSVGKLQWGAEDGGRLQLLGGEESLADQLVFVIPALCTVIIKHLKPNNQHLALSKRYPGLFSSALYAGNHQ